VNIAPFYDGCAGSKPLRISRQTIGVPRFGAATDFGMRMFLSKHGLEAHMTWCSFKSAACRDRAALSKELLRPRRCPIRWSMSPNKVGKESQSIKDEIPFVHRRRLQPSDF
jgi:hypothetical protein